MEKKTEIAMEEYRQGYSVRNLINVWNDGI